MHVLVLEKIMEPIVHVLRMVDGYKKLTKVVKVDMRYSVGHPTR